ncbi:YrbL family protein [Ruegeria arenilitoris]|uniref:YrbL family protein n=1 Tax=Ruegeria arenilitoris TaxID=1173585 RepID=UPI00147ABCE2|nr:YrbL family protein [Ruegeria arenilitoris]
MIDLSNRTVLRESQNYKIYDHPHFEGVLLKVRIDKPRDRFFKRYSTIRYGNLRQWQREANEYLAALNRGCPEIERLAAFYGYAKTSEGPAIAVEKMTGADGNLAKTVSDELRQFSKEDPRRKALMKELDELLTDLENGRILVGDISRQNIVRAQERAGKMVVIDGLGERTLLPLTVISDWAFRKSAARRRERMMR